MTLIASTYSADIANDRYAVVEPQHGEQWRS
jgi:hypothetical protein